MSKAKGAKAPEITSTLTKDKIVATNTNQAGLSEDSFQNLRNKISARLKTKDQKPNKTPKRPSETQAKDSQPVRGKKRAADGTLIPEQKSTKPDYRKNGAEHEGNDSEEELRNALKDLGGTQEDLDLIAGVDSDSELEGQDGVESTKQEPKKKGSTLEAGMANILKEIALAQGAREQDPSSEVEDDEGESDNEEGALLQDADSDAEASSALEPAPVVAEKPTKRNTGDSRLKCQPRADWFNNVLADVDLEKGPEFTASKSTIDQLHAHAMYLLTAENEAFKSTQQSSSSQMFYNTVIASGTLSDKISALTLAVQESPLHNMKALANLINLAGKRSRSQAVDVLRALKDLFAQGSLLPEDRRLVAFSSQPVLLLAAGQVRSWNTGDKLPRALDEHDMICWAFEDWLKQQYFEVLKILEVWCNDEIEFSKGRAVSYVYELLKEKPEQESNLLRLLVNKLGDPVKKIASQTSYLLMQLLSSHPAMKMIVISAIESDFIFRPGQSMHGKYYAAVTLNQTALSVREEDVAQKLLSIYFSMFTTILKTSNKVTNPAKIVDDGEEAESKVKSQTRGQRQRQRKNKSKSNEDVQVEELSEKLISAVLTGVNRAYPYVGTGQKNFNDHLETLFKITHSANFNTSIQAMLLIQQLTSTHSASAERFYRTLYESLLDPRLITASKQQLYLNLLHRALKADMNTKRVKAFVKRLMQVLSLHEPSFVCGVFFLLKDLEKTYPSLTALIDQPEDHENDEEVFRDVDEEASLPDRAVAIAMEEQKKKDGYDGNKRAPEHANADKSCAWEVLPFLAHFHPSVNISADHYIQHSKLPGKPDLTLHTLIHFLDRFVYRNPKLASNKLRGSSIMQPMVSDDTHAVLISSNTQRVGPAVNSDEFRNKKDDDVAADDVFFHKYFTSLGKETKAKKVKSRDVDDDGSVGDEGEDAVWKAMLDSAPDLEGESDGDEDLDMSDLESEMDAMSDDDEVPFDEEDDDDDVDIEAGIFDESDEDMLDVEAGEQVDALASESEAEFEGLSSEEEEDSHTKQKKEKRKAEKDKRKKMKALPTFASAADYAKMLDDEEDEDLG